MHSADLCLSFSNERKGGCNIPQRSPRSDKYGSLAAGALNSADRWQHLANHGKKASVEKNKNKDCYKAVGVEWTLEANSDASHLLVTPRLIKVDQAFFLVITTYSCG